MKFFLLLMNDDEDDFSQSSDESRSGAGSSEIESDADEIVSRKKRLNSEGSESDDDMIHQRAKRHSASRNMIENEIILNAGDGSISRAPDDNHSNSGSASDGEDHELGSSLAVADPDGVERAKASIAARDEYWSESKTSDSERKSYDTLIQLINLLNVLETPRKAMDRFLGRAVTEPKSEFKSTIRANKNKMGSSTIPNKIHQKDMVSFNRITELTDFMIGPGLVADVLDLSKETLTERLNRIPFEYRVKNEAGHFDIHGPVRYSALKVIGCSAGLDFRKAGSSDEWLALNIQKS